jgi:Raf kinase inhibitor-like YbhB/YbcL family protein
MRLRSRSRLSFVASLLASALPVACSPDDVPSSDAAALTLSSPALASTTFPAENTCAGADVSPPFAWTEGPAGTMSYAVVLTNLSLGAVHWVIWDLPAGTTSLPAALPPAAILTAPADAKQVHKIELFGAGGAYRGPCPRGATRLYEFEAHALGTATLADVTPASSVEDVLAAVRAASLAHGALAGTSDASPPAANDVVLVP